MNVGKKALSALHVLTLMFTAFWLVATSQAEEPAIDCFERLGAPSIEVTLGKRIPEAGTAPPSCSPLDGVTEGSRLMVSVTRAASRPKARGPSCWGYDVTELAGARHVAGLQTVGQRRRQSLLELVASFREDGVSAECAASYYLSVTPTQPPPQGKLADPFRAGGGEKWQARRSITFPGAAACKAARSTPGDFCSDSFEIGSIRRAP